MYASTILSVRILRLNFPVAESLTEQNPGAPNNSFLSEPLKRYFRLSRVTLKLCRFISDHAIIFLSLRSFQGNLSLFEITRAFFVHFPKILADIFSGFQNDIFINPKTRGLKLPMSRTFEVKVPLKGQYHAVFRNTLKIGKTRFG